MKNIVAKHGSVELRLEKIGRVYYYAVADNVFPCDLSRGWDTQKHAYEAAAREYNRRVPASAAICEF